MEDNQEGTLRTALGTPQRVFKRTQRYVCNGSYTVPGLKIERLAE